MTLYETMKRGFTRPILHVPLWAVHVMNIAAVVYLVFIGTKISAMYATTEEISISQQNALVEADLLSALREAEAARCAYLYLHDETLLRRYYIGLDTAATQFHVLEALLNSPENQRILAQLKFAMGNLYDLQTQTINDTRNHNYKAALELFRDGESEQLMMRIRSIVMSLRAKEHATQAKPAVFKQ